MRDNKLYIDDSGQHELWEEIQRMTDAERQEYIQKHEKKRQGSTADVVNLQLDY